MKSVILFIITLVALLFLSFELTRESFSYVMASFFTVISLSCLFLIHVDVKKSNKKY
jgi:formate-dependent nitrite reductase membrane component NrfD